MKTLVVGTGRSGTGWCAAVLNQAGIRCGHQAVFKHADTLAGIVPDWGDWEAECSYEAVPLLPLLGDVNVVLVVRHPLAVVKSWLEHGAFQSDMPERFGDFWSVLQSRFPAVLQQKTPIDRAASFWLMWNSYAQDYADVTLRLEGLHPFELWPAVQGSFAVAAEQPPVDPSQADKVATMPPIGWDDMSPWLGNAVQAYAESLGYDPR